MGILERTKIMRLLRVACLAIALPACSNKQVVCGGEVLPALATQSQLELVGTVKEEASGFCGREDAGCDFSVYNTNAGTTVKVTRMVSNQGKCINFIGDERFYSFDKSGRLQNVTNGL